MLKKTVSLHFKSHDAARHMTRRFLSYAQNAQEIHYLLASAPAGAAEGQKNVSSATKSKATASPPTTAQATVAVTQQSSAPETAVSASTSLQVTNVAPISDVPTPAREILLAIVGSKLRKYHNEVPAQQSIKALASGMSAIPSQIVIIILTICVQVDQQWRMRS